MTSQPAAPWLSVLLPVYNVAPYLEECLGSILSQVDPGVEIIALDDASTDESRDLLGDLASRHPDHIRVLDHTTNQGLSAARNHLLATATGTHVWFVDSDDIVAAGALAAARAILERHDPDLLLCGYQHKRPHPRRPPRTEVVFHGPARQLVRGRAAIIDGTFRAQAMYAWARVFRRSLHPEPDLFPVGRYFEDTHSTARLCLRAQTLYYEPSPWIHYRERPGSIMAHIGAQKAIDIVAALRGLDAEFVRSVAGLSFSARLAVADFCVHMYLMGCRHLSRADAAQFAAHRGEFESIFRAACPLSTAALVCGCALRPTRWRHTLRLLCWRRAVPLARLLRF